MGTIRRTLWTLRSLAGFTTAEFEALLPSFGDEGHCFPPGSKLLQDIGFQGYSPEGVLFIQPKKKPKGSELTANEKIVNRAISSLRVEVELQIGGVKHCQILMQKFRNRVENFVNEVMEAACGLHNFRLAHRR